MHALPRAEDHQTLKTMAKTRETLRFGDFELDVAAYELRRHGRAVRLERHPMDLLLLLVERRNDLVSRAEIVELLWGKDVFVDVETGVHTAMRKIRQALRDSAETPTFVETVPGRGYRFIAPVEVVGKPPEAVPASPPSAPAGGTLSRTAECVAGPAGPAASSHARRAPCRRPDRRRRFRLVEPGRCGRIESADHARRAAIREHRERSRASVPGRRSHRRDERIARADRSRAPERQGSHPALQGHDEVRRGDRARARGRLPSRKRDSVGRRCPARHGQADSRAGSGIRVDPVLRSGRPPTSWVCSGR